jgi:hypothetical protein
VFVVDRKSPPPYARASLLAALLIGLPGVLAAQDAEKRARELFGRLNESTALAWDLSTIRLHARLAGARALPDLLRIYEQPPCGPQVPFKALVAGRIGELPRPKAADLVLLRAFVARLARSEADTWVTFQAFRVLARAPEARAELLTIAKQDRSAPRRAAAIEALGREGGAAWVSETRALIEAAQKLSKEHQRALVLASIAWSVARVAKPDLSASDDDSARAEHARAVNAALREVAALGDDKKTSARIRRQLGLALRFADPNRKPAAKPRPEPEGKGSRTRRRAPPVSFMSIKTEGRRFLFLVDASDSMLTPLTDAERSGLRRLLEQGKPADAKQRKGTQTRRAKQWAAVKTRFDAVRLHISQTLRGMGKSHMFAIVLFGSQARLLPETKGFRRANKKGVATAIAGLWKIKAGLKSNTRPHGRLYGATNLYRALNSAFRVGGPGELKSIAPGVDRRLVQHGADTIFLLTDGTPTEDGFPGTGPPIKGLVPEVTGGAAGSGGQTTDKETGVTTGTPYKPGKAGKATGRMRTVVNATKYENGPYTSQGMLLEEVERLNLLRKVVIHVVSIGEAGQSLPKRIAKLSRGRFVSVAK